jgi:hypothetical protein
MFEGFLVVVVFICRYTFRNPREEIRLDLDDILAWQTSQDRQLTSTNDETRGKELGELNSIALIADDTIQNKCIRLREKKSTQNKMLKKDIVIPLGEPG